MIKKKIINDPIYGLISIQSELIFELIEHPLFQRLRRIKQLGLSYLIFPGANHTRFEHSIGATFLMQEVIKVLKYKGHSITDEEKEAACIAILLHDLGHMPFSHSLEYIFTNVSHEQLSLILMEQLNKEYDGRLKLAIDIFNNDYHKKCLHQLVSSQLDVDRLDYLMRDSFYTGVSEGIIGFDRIIKMIDVEKDKLVIEAKGIYSVENFLIARRLMYWQVYLHKTVVAADQMLINTLKRAKHLFKKNVNIFTTPSLSAFFEYDFKLHDFKENVSINNLSLISHLTNFDDTDILMALKSWRHSSDTVLSTLSNKIINRKLFKAQIISKKLNNDKINMLLKNISVQFGVTQKEAKYFLINDKLSHSAYDISNDNIYLVDKNREIADFKDISDINFKALSKTKSKYFVSYPKELVVV